MFLVFCPLGGFEERQIIPFLWLFFKRFQVWVRDRKSSERRLCPFTETHPIERVCEGVRTRKTLTIPILIYIRILLVIAGKQAQELGACPRRSCWLAAE